MGTTQRNRLAADPKPATEKREGAEVEQTEVRVTQRRASGPSNVELMLVRARMVLARMAPADPRARLLQVALLRRDEILLEALLRRIDGAPL